MLIRFDELEPSVVSHMKGGEGEARLQLVQDMDNKIMRSVLASVNDGKVTLLAVCGKDAVARGIKAGDIIKAIAPICGGKGGGKPDSAMGGGTEVSKVDDALAAVDDFVAGRL